MNGMLTKDASLTSGAAYGGEPHHVANNSSGLKKFENPKSAILIFLFESNNKFSAWNEMMYEKLKYETLHLEEPYANLMYVWSVKNLI